MAKWYFSVTFNDDKRLRSEKEPFAYEYKLVLLCMDMDVEGFYFTYLIVL